jgi:type I restriction enzyme M protein
VATLEEIENNGFNLNIPLYVEPLAKDDAPTLEEAFAELELAFAEVESAEEHLRGLLRKRGLLA